MRKGFTLVELLGVIVIMGVIALIAVPAVDSVVKKGKEKAYDITKSTIITATKNWLLDNKSLLDDGETVNVTLADLKEQGYLEFDIKNPSSGNCLDNTMEVSISRNGKKYTYAITGDELVDSSDSDCEATGRAPSIYLLGSNPVNVEINTPFVDLGAKATDTEGNDISYKIIKPDVINTSVLATNLSYKYTILSDGITKTISRKVNVIDTTKPVITGAVDTTITTSDTTFNIMNGVSATDNSGETIVVKTKSNLTLGVKGEYTVTYIATDSSGNTISKTRKIKVEKPTYTLLSYSSDNYFWNNTYRNKIESINFVDYVDTTGSVISWDLSAAKNGTITGWLMTDLDNPSYYKMYIGSAGYIYANPNSSNWFANLSSVYSIKFNNFDTSNVIDMGSMFDQANSLASVDLTVFNTSNVTNMAAMFSSAYSLVNLDLSSFNTSKVTNMTWMFANTYSLTSLDVSSFDTSNVVNMSRMFYTADALISLDLSNFNTPNVIDMSSMFDSTTSLVSLNVSSFNTSNVTNMSAMFSGMNSLLTLNLSNFDTSKVTNMAWMFANNQSLTSLDISNFNTSNVVDMTWMFNSARSLTSLNVSSFNTSKVTSMSGMFDRMVSLTSLNISNFNTSNVYSMSGMFSGTRALTTLNLGNFNTSKVTDMSWMFNSVNFVTLDLSSFDTKIVTNMSYMFSYSSYLNTIYVGINWVTTGAQKTDMFLGCGTSTVTPK